MGTSIILLEYATVGSDKRSDMTAKNYIAISKGVQVPADDHRIRATIVRYAAPYRDASTAVCVFTLDTEVPMPFTFTTVHSTSSISRCNRNLDSSVNKTLFQNRTPLRICVRAYDTIRLMYIGIKFKAIYLQFLALVHSNITSFGQFDLYAITSAIVVEQSTIYALYTTRPIARGSPCLAISNALLNGKKQCADCVARDTFGTNISCNPLYTFVCQTRCKNGPIDVSSTLPGLGDARSLRCCEAGGNYVPCEYKNDQQPSPQISVKFCFFLTCFYNMDSMKNCSNVHWDYP